MPVRDPSAFALAWGLQPSRTLPPRARQGTVAHTRLLDILTASRQPIVSIVAPAGYGKTTVLSRWAASDHRPCIWVSIGNDCNDPTVLFRYVAEAIGGVIELERTVFDELDRAHPRVDSVVLGGFAAALQHAEPVLMVIDDLHLLVDDHCIDLVRALPDNLPQGSQMAYASRHGATLALGKARAQGDVCDVGVTELRFDEAGAGELMLAAGVDDLDEAQVAALTEQTEGWPVGLYLAALARKAGSVRGFESTVAGDDRYIADYLRQEVLDRLDASQVEFLVRTSVLDEMWGSLCDAVLGSTGSGIMLERLEGSNLLVVPLDRRRERYRYHHLFRDLLRSELERRAPELVSELAGRASRWCEDNDKIDLAIGYAIEAHDVDRVAQLLQRHARRAYSEGLAASLSRWFAWLDTQTEIERFPVTAVQGAWIMALTGHAVESERWTDAAERGHAASLVADEPGVRARRAPLFLLRALQCRHGIDRMQADVEMALEALPSNSGWRASALVTNGLVAQLQARDDSAIARYEEAADVAEATGAAPSLALAFAERALIALGAADPRDADAWAGRSLSVVRRSSLRGYPQSAVSHVAAARAALLLGDVERARPSALEAASLLPSVTVAVPPFAVQLRIHLARCAIGLGDLDLAQRCISEGETLLHRRRGLGVLEVQFRSARHDLQAAREDARPTITPAEARILPLLPTHMSFREIAEQLYLSPHTVKTQAISIYRKLGVSSRGHAIDEARRVGLLP